MMKDGSDPRPAPECQCIYELMDAVDSYTPNPSAMRISPS
jgi:hypothetical protein